MNIKIIKEYKGGFVGGLLVLILLAMTFYTLFFIPPQLRIQWTNPLYWSDNPKDASPIWVNYILNLFNQQLPEHKIFQKKDTSINVINETGFKMENSTFSYRFNFNEFPTAFDIPYSISVGQIPPVLEVYVKRPDNLEFKIFSNSIDSTNNIQLENSSSSGYANTSNSVSFNNSTSNYNDVIGRIFSSSSEVKNSLDDYSSLFNFSISGLSPEKIIFSQTAYNLPLKGNYLIKVAISSFDNDTNLKDLKLIMHGKVFGMLGTDELRRDVFFGILLGTPVDLLIGVTVALSSTFIGLFYGLIAGYKERKTGTIMLTLIDIFISVPSLILLIIISIHYGRSLLILIGLFILFGWPGLALLNRTFSIQIKNYQYVQASKLMGESDFKIILRHIVPQLLPFTLANFALAVPAAILTESALSFLGLGDPSFPTWGQMLQDAHASSAEILGYWWWIVSPGFMISLTSVAFILLGRSFENVAKRNRKF
ncbi:MAG: ABC transporter permease [Candidatus Nitrosocosmicus sp.]